MTNIVTHATKNKSIVGYHWREVKNKLFSLLYK